VYSEGLSRSVSSPSDDLGLEGLSPLPLGEGLCALARAVCIRAASHTPMRVQAPLDACVSEPRLVAAGVVKDLSGT
jgi:hypothetical protein